MPKSDFDDFSFVPPPPPLLLASLLRGVFRSGMASVSSASASSSSLTTGVGDSIPAPTESKDTVMTPVPAKVVESLIPFLGPFDIHFECQTGSHRDAGFVVTVIDRKAGFVHADGNDRKPSTPITASAGLIRAIENIQLMYPGVLIDIHIESNMSLIVSDMVAKAVRDRSFNHVRKIYLVRMMSAGKSLRDVTVE